MATITVEGLGKRYGALEAVRDVSFTLRPAAVTGFIGANGAGKTTTLRMVLGLIRPSAGTAVVDGVVYRKLEQPLRHVGALLDAATFHPGRTGRDSLRVLARAAGLPDRRVDHVLEEVELERDAGRRVGGYSLGMRQRLGLAAALLGDPQILILDEPTNGLDPEGIHWLRSVIRRRADEGGTVLVSSHVLTELAAVVDDVLVISRGGLVAHETVAAGVDLEHRYRELVSQGGSE